MAGVADALVHIDVAVSSLGDQALGQVLLDEVVRANSICIAWLARARIRVNCH